MRRIGIGTILAAGMLIGGVQAVGAGQVSAPEPVTFTVEAGQSLWEIAGIVAPERDKRDVVQDLMQLNALPSPTLLPGQTLVVPE